MHTTEPTVLLISPDTALCTAVRSVLKSSEPLCHVAAVSNFADARRSAEEISPDVIVLQESSLNLAPGSHNSHFSPLADVVSALAAFAPVIVLGQHQIPPSLSALIAAGAADFVSGGESVPAAAACVEKRLANARRSMADALTSLPPTLTGDDPANLESFGELLRHELNNPLTGILGNAELLLAEARRQKAAQLPEQALKRLETIAALAVRMRETVRRLSQACECRSEQQQARSA